jgi:hypothetical protein
LAEDLSRRLNASYLPAQPGRQIAGIYEQSITTPTGKLAIIRRQNTFTLGPWRPALEPFKGRAVMEMIGPSRVTWLHPGSAIARNIIIPVDITFGVLSYRLDPRRPRKARRITSRHPDER